VLAFGAHSTIDWTWFVPGVAIPALFCAGWLAGRGPLAAPVGRREHARAIAKTPAVGAALAGLAAVVLLAVWAVWQPLRSADAASAAITQASKGQLGAALSSARVAVARDPLALAPRFELSALYSAAHDERAARAALVDAVHMQPQNFESWLALGEYDLRHGRPQLALRSLNKTMALNVNSVPGLSDVAQAKAAIAAARANGG
jgi:cytochrome c-type biogenesis protein CcmH/NrfG